jgi:hypothetical protein
LYQDFTNPKNFKPAMAQLLREIECHAKDGESAKSAKVSCEKTLKSAGHLCLSQVGGAPLLFFWLA